MDLKTIDLGCSECTEKHEDGSILKNNSWPHQLREIVSQRCPTWPAVHCGSFTVSYCVFISFSVRIRDELIHAPLPVLKKSKVLLFYTDTPLSRLKYICTITALAMIGASFTLLEEKMPLRARLHVVQVYAPDLLLDVSSAGSQSVEELLPLNSPLPGHDEVLHTPLPVMRLFLDEVVGASPRGVGQEDSWGQGSNLCESAAATTNHDRYTSFDEKNWAKVTEKTVIVMLLQSPLSSNINSNTSQEDLTQARGRFWCRSDYHDIAFVDWTSGSTGGLPKGCYCKHSTLSNMLHAKYFSSERLFDSRVREVVGVNLFNLWYWWQPVCSGHTTAMLLSSEVTDIALLFQGIARMEITAMDCITPSLLQTMLHCRASSPQFFIPATMIVGGEMLTLACARQFYSDAAVTLTRQGSSHISSEQLVPSARLINLFSTTETGDCSYYHVSPSVIQELLMSDIIHCPIGSSIQGVALSIDKVGDKGLIVGGVDTDHYLCDPVTTQKYFDSRGWLSYDQAAHITVCGKEVILLIGRSDDCVKVRGFKVDLNAVEEAIVMSGTVVMASVQHHAASDSLVAFVVLKEALPPSADPSSHPSLRFLDRLPKSHLPQVVEVLQTMPIGRTGKVDRRAVMENYLLKVKMQAEELARSDAAAAAGIGEEESPVTAAVRAAWKQVLDWSGGLEKCFWDCGGHSLLAMQLCAKLSLPSALLFGGDLSTAQEMIDFLEARARNSSKGPSQAAAASIFPTLPARPDDSVAIVGMSGRWPGIGEASCEDLFAAFTGPEEFEPLSAAPAPSGLGNVARGFYLDESLIRGFDCNFWNMTKDDALLCDPQLRCFLEMSYEAFCDAGVMVEPRVSAPLNCGVFACSGSLPHYLELLLDGRTLSQLRSSDPAKYFNLELGNDKDYLATRLAYLFNLVGPVECVQTACSSGLVAVSRAVEAIRSGQCEVAIAGGVSIFSPQQEHAYMPDLIWSADGRCKPFDATASGTANCNGGQVFLLKSLSAALRDGDSIYGCVKGTAVRNDGRLGKRNFNAPSSVGYTRTVEAALQNARLADGSSIRMLEAHATATIVGDPIEMAGIGQAYGAKSSHPLSVGSVKGNIGHANTAAGLMAMAKSVMCIYKDHLVPSGNFTSCSESIAHEIKKSARLIEIQTRVAKFDMEPRRAGVSAMGIGGTCAHVILEQAPRAEPEPTAGAGAEVAVGEGGAATRYLLLSAASPESLERYIKKLANHFTHRDENLCVDALCCTLGNWRPSMKYRRSIAIPPHRACDTRAVLAEALTGSTAQVSSPSVLVRKSTQKTVVLVFPGQGIALPRCISCMPAVVERTLGFDPLAKYWEGGGTDAVLYQLSMFAVQLAIGIDVVSSLGSGMQIVGMGHSLGEWVVAALSGLLTLEEAVLCVQARAEILVRHTGESAGMICVCASLSDTLTALGDFDEALDLEVSCVNGDNRIVLSGSKKSCEEFTTNSKLVCKRVETECAFHSKRVDAGMPDLEKSFSRVLESGSQPRPSVHANWRVVSSHTCELMTARTCTPTHWAQQTRGCVNFARAVDKVGELAGPNSIWLLSFGVSKTLCAKPAKVGFSCVQNDMGGVDIKAAVARAWELGVEIDMQRMVGLGSDHARVLALPGYAWDRDLCWPQQAAVSRRSALSVRQQIDETGHQPARDVRKTVFIEAWLPVYSAYKSKLPASDVFPVSHLSLTTSSKSAQSAPDILDSQFRTAVQACCEAIESTGRLVISMQNCFQSRPSEASTTASVPTAQCILLSRFLLLVQSILGSEGCLQALRRALPHPALACSRGGVVLLLEEGEGREGSGSWERAGAVLGAARCVANEHPELRLRIVRVKVQAQVQEEETQPWNLAAIAGLSSLFFDLDVPIGEYRQGAARKISVRTMQPLDAPLLSSEQEQEQAKDNDEGGTFVISGGLGSLGKLVAAWLCSFRGARVVHLLTRRPEVVLADDKLLVFGDRVQVVQGDVCDLSSLSSCGIDWHAITGVVHCAGDVFDSLVKSAPTELSVLQQQLFVKTLGFSNLSSLVKSSTEFICFSSASGCLGSLGQVTYCAANCALDVMVDCERMKSGRKVVSIQWGGWSKEIAGSMSDRYNVDPSGPFETFYSADAGIAAMAHAVHSIGRGAETETAVCMAIDINSWESYASSTGVSKSLLSALLISPLDDVSASSVQRKLALPSVEQLLWQPRWQWLGDHRADEQVIFPATASLELLLGANTCLHNVTFEKTIIAGDIVQVKGLSIETESGVCVRAASVAAVSAGGKSGQSASLPPASAVCVTLAALSLARETSSADPSITNMSSHELYSKMEENNFAYGPAFALVNVTRMDRELGVAIGHVRGRSEAQRGHVNERFFPLAPELDACAHVCTAVDEATACAYPIAVEKFSVQTVDFTNIDSYEGLRGFCVDHSVTDNDWVVICRKHCSKIELEFDLVCLRRRDSCVVTFERLCLKTLPRPLRSGSLSSCVCVHLCAPLEDGSAADTSEIALEMVSLDEDGPPACSDLKFNANEDFEVVVDADYLPSFIPLPAVCVAEAPPPGHIVVRVTTYALNFLDVLSASGMMPKEYFGGECVGVVEAVGEGVTRLGAGDRVALLLLGQGMKSRLCVHASLASPPLPASITDEEAATIPVAYATAWLALEWMGRVNDGETALVHSAAGGVGLACVSILRAHKCRILCSCSPGKEATLQAMGVQPQDIFHSRLPASWLSGCFKSLKGKADVSICLGAFVGDSLSLSLNLMAPLGRVLDFGKRDQLEQSSLNMAPFLKGLTYSAAHLDELMSDAEGTERLLGEVWSSLFDKVVPLPCECFDVEDTQAAVSRLASGKLVGKVVIRFPRKSDPAACEVVHAPAWTVTVHPGDFDRHSLEILDVHLHRQGGALLHSDSDSISNSPTICLKRCATTGQNGFPVVDAGTEHQRSVLISPDMGADLAHFAEYCAAACRHAALRPQSSLLMCMERSSLLAAGCVPRPWRRVARELRAQNITDGLGEGGALQWLLALIEQATGMGPAEALLHSLDELGFDSLSCLQLSHKLQQAFPNKSTFHIPGHVIVGDIFESARPATEQERARITAPQPPVSEPKRWLALHGFRMNSQIFRYQLENIINEVDALQQERGLPSFSLGDLACPDAPLFALGPGEEGLEQLYVSIVTAAASSWGQSARAGVAMPLYEWWRSGVQGEDYETAWNGDDGLSQAFEWLVALVQAGEFAGVIGMSQGAGMAYLLMLTGIVPRGLLFSPVGPTSCESFMQTLIEASPVPPAASTPVGPTRPPPLLVVWDPQDAPSEDFVRGPLARGPLQLREVHHDGGHVVPQDVSTGRYAKKRHVVEAIAAWLRDTDRH